ncbi:RNA polymerase sigma-70 factor (ECF subfamily) [Mucilaginibacter gracilis]|uniref:RNA polymerase sigma-70 factor (ECF subfamily) n=1 Tax=Mucilaginibacter gracilis TaxID=423350 RepID=A0A495IZM3_9SPHI|nr:sigma-70 family RNA polymerase sigma factor [Mucilaginibacter gracilis]RKR82137.1 RNA polymerase sigma-70 factor (ECF subfamily) [Mucilaginibacter gracilis]
MQTVNPPFSFEKLYREQWSALYLFAYNIVRDREIARDIVQEVFTALLQNPNPASIENHQAYLQQAVKYQVYNLVRADKVQLRAFEQVTPPTTADSTNELISFKELSRAFDLSIVSLPVKCREIFDLKQQGFTARQIARDTGLSIRTVETHLYNAVKKIRTSLAQLISLAAFLAFLPF